MKDMLGNEIKVGDTMAWPVSDGMRFGVVIKINHQHDVVTTDGGFEFGLFDVLVVCKIPGDNQPMP